MLRQVVTIRDGPRIRCGALFTGKICVLCAFVSGIIQMTVPIGEKGLVE